LSHGILNEIYYPREDQACTRDLGLIVTAAGDFFSEEKRHTDHQVTYLTDGVPAFHLVNTCREGRYSIEKEVLTDPQRDALLQRIRFKPLKGTLADYRLYALLAPHLGNHGGGNTTWVGHHNGVEMLFAQRGGLALACSATWTRASAGFVSYSDGWQDLTRHKHLTWTYQRAENGNVALTGEMDLNACKGCFILALGFGNRPAEAGHRALAALLDDFEVTRDQYLQDQQDRWETSPGYSPFTLAAEIAALLAAADLAERVDEGGSGRVLTRDRRCLELQHRALDRRDRLRYRAPGRGPRLLRARRVPRPGAGRFTGPGLRPDQEPSSR
jgi:glucoamylase